MARRGMFAAIGIGKGSHSRSRVRVRARVRARVQARDSECTDGGRAEIRDEIRGMHTQTVQCYGGGRI